MNINGTDRDGEVEASSGVCIRCGKKSTEPGDEIDISDGSMSVRCAKCQCTTLFTGLTLTAFDVGKADGVVTVDGPPIRFVARDQPAQAPKSTDESNFVKDRSTRGDGILTPGSALTFGDGVLLTLGDGKIVGRVESWSPTIPAAKHENVYTFDLPAGEKIIVPARAEFAMTADRTYVNLFALLRIKRNRKRRISGRARRIRG